MCGIVSFLTKSSIVDKNLFKNALDQLIHRGPDHQGLWLSKDKKVGLGHMRLSIIDLDGGAQPLENTDKKIIAVVNGEFYEYKNIRHTLSSSYEFKTNSDSEILLALYSKYDLDCVNYLRGEFAFILWDSKKERLFAARDRFGIKPLYYAVVNGNIFLASEIKSLIKLGVSPIWNPYTILYSNHSIYHQELTCFEGIYSLKPGYYLTATKDKYSVRKYWDINLSVPKNVMQEKNYIEQYRAHIEDAVRERLIADVPIGCYLSGGIDSSAVLAIATKFCGNPLTAFNIKFENSLFDESNLAKETAKWLGAKYSEVTVTQDDMVNNFERTIWHAESIVNNMHGVALYLLSKHVRNSGFKAILNGGGADEFLCGYQFFKEDDIISRYKTDKQNELSSLLNQIRSNSPIASGLTSPFNKTETIHNFNHIFESVPTLIKIYLSRGKEFSNLYKHHFKSIYGNQEIIIQFLKQLNINFKEIEQANISTYLFSKSTLSGYILSSIGDRMEMANSIEGRVPFLDHKLVEFTLKIPTNLKINNLTEKYILRECVKDMLPKQIYMRTKQPFFAPPSDNCRLYKFMEDVFLSTALKESPFYDQKSVLNLLWSLHEMPINKKIFADSMLTEILSTCILQDQYKIRNMSTCNIDNVISEITSN